MDNTLIVRLEALLSAYGVPPEERKDVLQVILLKVIYLWGKIRDPEAWMLAELRKQLEIGMRRPPANE